MATSDSRGSCYLCGTTEGLTRDHIPPLNLFPTPRPNNLITVDCCESCNQAMALSDERMRVFLSAPAGRSQAGDQAWERVVQSSFRRSEPLRTQFAKSMIEVLALRNGVISPHQAITHPQDEVKAYILRITKGLLRNFYPNLDYREHVFSVDHLNPLPADDVGMLIANFTHDFRGDDVFRFFRGVISEPCMGIWVYLFYERVWFMATHGPADVLKSYPGFASVES